MQANKTRNLLFKTLLGLAITVALVVFLFRYINLDQLGQMFSQMRWDWCLIGAGLWVLLYVVRATRFVLISPRTPFLTMLAIASVHNFLLRLLPMRTGDLSYGFLVRKSGTAGLGESLLSLLLIRLLDASTVVVLFMVALVLDQDLYREDRGTSIMVAAVGAVILLAIVLTLPRFMRFSFTVLQHICRATGLLERPRVERLLEKVGRAVDSFSSTKLTVILRCAAISPLVWLLTFGTFYAILQTFSIPVGYVQTILGATAAVVTSFLPIGGIGSFGTLEAGWTLGFVLVGLDQSQAVASGFGVSIVTFGYSTVLCLAGWMGLTAIARRNKRRE